MLSQKIIDKLNDIITDEVAKDFGEDSKDAVINKLVNYNPDSYNLIHKIREYTQQKMGDVLNELVMSDSSQESLLKVKQKATNISFLYDIVLLSIQKTTIESMEEKYFGKKNKGLK